MKFNNTKAIAIDENVLTFFVEAATLGYIPDIHSDDKNTKKLEMERVATFQIPLYSEWYAILPAVRAEYKNIKHNAPKLLFHQYADEIFRECEERFLKRDAIKRRALEFNTYHHTGHNNYHDCLITAEAESIADTTILLSYDFKLIKRLSPVVHNLIIMKPTEFKSRFNLKDEQLKREPSDTSYLAHETWWRL